MVRIVAPDAELFAVQRAAYLVEAALIGSDAIPALHETAHSLVAAELTWFGCRDDAGLLGAAAISETAGVVDVERLVVAPRAFRCGVGTALVHHVLFLTDGPVTVSTGRANTPARRLYERCGFIEVGEAEVVPELWITRYEHRPRLSVASASVILVVNRRMSARQVVSHVRMLCRGRGDLTFDELAGRGKGSHRIYLVRDKAGQEVGRVTLTDHAGDLSWAVLRDVEKQLTHLFGDKWTEKH